MARRPITSSLQAAGLFQISSAGDIILDENAYFLINPESYEDSKANTGWIGNNIPGQSLPIYQWVSGGPRIITFEALVTKDTSYFNNSDEKQTSDPFGQLAQQGLAAIGSLASNFLGVPIPSGQILGYLSDQQEPGFLGKLEVGTTLNYYRSLYAPTYNNAQLVQSPPLLYFFNPSINSSSFSVPDSIDQTSEVYILTSLGIKITKQLYNLIPMEATVSFQLEQYPITAVGNNSEGTPQAGDGSLGSVIASLK